MFEKSFLRSTRPTLRHICTEFGQRSATTPSSFGTNLPQSVTHISQKAFFKHALGHEEQYTYDALGRAVEKADQEGLTTRWSYTPMGQVERILYGDGKEVRYTYAPMSLSLDGRVQC